MIVDSFPPPVRTMPEKFASSKKKLSLLPESSKKRSNSNSNNNILKIESQKRCGERSSFHFRKKVISPLQEPQELYQRSPVSAKNSSQVKFFQSDYFSYFCVLHNSILREKVCRNLSFYARPVIVKYKSKNVMVSSGEEAGIAVTQKKFRDACFVRLCFRLRVPSAL